MTDIELCDLTVRLTNGEIHAFRGVYSVLTEGVLSVFTVGFLDPAVWRAENDGPEHVISYSLAAVLSWTERDNEAATPYVIPPEFDLDGRPFDRGEPHDA